MKHLTRNSVGGWLEWLPLLRCRDGVVKILQQDRESEVLHFVFGAGENASCLWRTAVVLRGGDLLGKSEELKGRLDLAGEVGEFGGIHGSADDMGRMSWILVLAIS